MIIKKLLIVNISLLFMYASQALAEKQYFCIGAAETCKSDFYHKIIKNWGCGENSPTQEEIDKGWTVDRHYVGWFNEKERAHAQELCMQNTLDGPKPVPFHLTDEGVRSGGHCGGRIYGFVCFYSPSLSSKNKTPSRQ